MRAVRFPLRLPLRYRPVGDPVWHEGRTENISHTGVLFRGDEPLQVDTPVELRLVLPISAEESYHPEVYCHARIVRTVPRTSDQRLGLAVSIDAYHFGRDQA